MYIHVYACRYYWYHYWQCHRLNSIWLRVSLVTYSIAMNFSGCYLDKNSARKQDYEKNWARSWLEGKTRSEKYCEMDFHWWIRNASKRCKGTKLERLCNSSKVERVERKFHNRDIRFALNPARLLAGGSSVCIAENHCAALLFRADTMHLFDSRFGEIRPRVKQVNRKRWNCVKHYYSKLQWQVRPTVVTYIERNARGTRIIDFIFAVSRIVRHRSYTVILDTFRRDMAWRDAFRHRFNSISFFLWFLSYGKTSLRRDTYATLCVCIYVHIRMYIYPYYSGLKFVRFVILIIYLIVLQLSWKVCTFTHTYARVMGNSSTRRWWFPSWTSLQAVHSRYT